MLEFHNVFFRYNGIPSRSTILTKGILSMINEESECRLSAELGGTYCRAKEAEDKQLVIFLVLNAHICKELFL